MRDDSFLSEGQDFWWFSLVVYGRSSKEEQMMRWLRSSQFLVYSSRRPILVLDPSNAKNVKLATTAFICFQIIVCPTTLSKSKKFEIPDSWFCQICSSRPFGHPSEPAKQGPTKTWEQGTWNDPQPTTTPETSNEVLGPAFISLDPRLPPVVLSLQQRIPNIHGNEKHPRQRKTRYRLGLAPPTQTTQTSTHKTRTRTQNVRRQ